MKFIYFYKMRLNLYWLFLIFTFQPALAQDDSTALKMNWFASAKPNTNLFVHFDKNVYTNNEIVYFSAYLLNGANSPQNKHKIISLCLIRDLDTAIIVQDKFLIKDGLSSGSINLPDSILTGNYHFVAYTDLLLNNLPSAIYQQPITIKTNIDPAFKASLKILENVVDVKKNHEVLLSATTKDNRFLQKPLQINYRYGTKTLKTKTDASGQLLIKLPVQNDLSDPNLYIKLNNDKDTSYLTLPLPTVKNKASVKFYPEGGNLVLGLPSVIGWEVKDQHKQPVALRAFLYENNLPIDTIETTSYGIGKFKLTPKNSALYSLKLIHSGLADSIYQLPSAIAKGVVVNIQNAVTQDTLSVIIKNNTSKKLLFLIHNFREVYLNLPLEMNFNRSILKIPLTAIPKGLMSLTILDSLKRPLAERMFFAHHNSAENIRVETDKKSYQQREKVTLNLKLNLDTIGLVSIACIQDNRLQTKNNNDIESYTYLTSQLNTLPIILKDTPYKNVNYLEQILLVKGWRKYTWQDLQKATSLDTIVKKDSLQILGWITKSKKPLSKPITLASLSSNNLGLIETSASGHFNFNTEELILEQGSKSFLFISDKNKFDYTLHFNDEFLKMSQKIAKTTVFENPILPSTIVNNADLVLKSNEKAIRLKEVVIKSKKDNSIGYLGAQGSNACGDYVCLYNILNCPNHRTDFNNTEPIVGRSYYTNGYQKVYQECRLGLGLDENYLQFNGIHFQKEFYINDYKDPQEPAFFSTIYWNYNTVINNKKETKIEFYSSDITGKFRVVVQGITEKDVIYGEHFFEVNPSKTP